VSRIKGLRSLSLSFLLASAFATPGFAQINFNINIAPPAPQQEIIPSLPSGQVWAPGYWAWSGERHVWVRGRPIVQREGYRWEADRWEQRDRGYYRHAGHWEPVKAKKPKKQKKQKKHKKHDH
jgi:hypothetical protein